MTSAAAHLLRFVWSHPENRRERFRAIGRLVTWQIWQRVVRRPWVIGFPGALRLKCYPHSTAATGVLYCRLPEWEDMRFVLDFLRPGDGFVDVGANVGTYSLLAATTPGAQIWSFEPATQAFDRLRENVALNQLESRLRTYRVAVGAAPGRALVTTGGDTVNRLLQPGESAACEEVAVVALDHVIDAATARSVRLMKIDVEGFEEQVLRGAERILQTSAPVLIVEANDPATLSSLLTPLGYRPCSYDPRRRRLVDAAWSGARGNNVLAVQDAVLVAKRLAQTDTA